MVRMVRRRSSSWLLRLRRWLLVFLVLFVAGLVGLFLFGRAGLSTRAETSTGAMVGGADRYTVEGKAFDFTLFQEERAVFRIRGDHTRADRENNVYLEKVFLTFFRQDGEYHLESERATYNQDSHAAHLEGDITMRGPHEVVVKTDWLRLEEQGNLLVASRGTKFSSGDRMVGEAATLRVNFEEETFLLGGGVQIRSTPQEPVPFALQAWRVSFRDSQRLLRAEGDVRLQRGEDYLRGSFMSLFLAEDTNDVRFVRALRQVSGEIRPQAVTDEESPSLRFAGSSLALLLDTATGDPRKVELQGNRRRKARVRSRRPDGGERSLVGAHIAGTFRNGILDTAEALGPVKMVERAQENGRRAVRTASALRAEARFDAVGNLGGLTLEDQVTLDAPPFHALGDLAYLDFEVGRAEVFGDPVSVRGREGELFSPHVVYWRDKDLLHARDGVRSTLTPDAQGAIVPFEGEQGPLRIEAREAFWQRNSQEFLFRDNVRAWQGKNLLLAQQLRGDRQGEQISASGQVKTIWHPPPPEPGAEPERDVEEGGPPPTGPIEVTAQYMSYLRLENRVLYTEQVLVDQGGRRLACDELEVLTRDDNVADRLICTGRVSLKDPYTGRTIEGQRAVYRLDEGEVDFFGDPLTLRDPQGGWIQGKQLRYYVEDGAVEVTSGEAPSPHVDSPSSG